MLQNACHRTYYVIIGCLTLCGGGPKDPQFSKLPNSPKKVFGICDKMSYQAVTTVIHRRKFKYEMHV